MSGTIDDGSADVPKKCEDGFHALEDLETGQWHCVPNVHVEPWMLIWQGDCDGWLVVRLSHAPAINPAEAPVMRSGGLLAPPLARLGKRIAGPEVSLQTLGRRVSAAKLTAMLKKQLKGRVAPAAGAPKRSKKAAKKAARPKARSARRKK